MLLIPRWGNVLVTSAQSKKNRKRIKKNYWYHVCLWVYSIVLLCITHVQRNVEHQIMVQCIIVSPSDSLATCTGCPLFLTLW